MCAGDKHSLSKGPCLNRGVLMTLSTSAALGKGGGVLDKPIIEKTTPGRESEFDLRYAYNNLNFTFKLPNSYAFLGSHF